MTGQTAAAVPEIGVDDLTRAARTVLGYYRTALDLPGNAYATGQSTAALAVWADLVWRNPNAALDLARQLAPEVPS